MMNLTVFFRKATIPRPRSRSPLVS